jgi:hypothetical protein
LVLSRQLAKTADHIKAQCVSLIAACSGLLLLVFDAGRFIARPTLLVDGGQAVALRG